MRTCSYTSSIPCIICDYYLAWAILRKKLVMGCDKLGWKMSLTYWVTYFP
jgi:hypothetical protein